jgi:hypothetical protein
MTKDRKLTRAKLQKFCELRNAATDDSPEQFATDATAVGFDAAELDGPWRLPDAKDGSERYAWETPVGQLRKAHGNLKLYLPPGRWVITRDYISRGTDSKSAVGTASRYYEDGEDLPHPFRMLDDDGNVYYHGKCSSCDDEHAFAPLEDFGTPNAGCTEIQYKNAKGEWKTL